MVCNILAKELPKSLIVVEVQFIKIVVIVSNIFKFSRFYCAQIIGWVIKSFANIEIERRLFVGYVKQYE